MAQQPEHFTPTHRYSASEAAAAVAKAFAEPDANSILAALHKFEFDFAYHYEWPWMRWRHLNDDDPAYMAALPAQVPTLKPEPEQDSLEETLLASALDMRRSLPADGEAQQNAGDANARAALFTAGDGLIAASARLGRSLQLELVLAAYHERRWRAVELLALQLLKQGTVTGDEALDQKISHLLVDMVFFAIYRSHTPGYVDNPALLYGKLDALKDNPLTKPILSGSSTTATTYRANMLAMKGKFTAALPLYDKVAAESGFRSPVFPHAQVLLPVESLIDDNRADNTRADDMQWYHARSQTEFTYTHASEGEHAVLVACEQGYFYHYGHIYCQIVGHTNPGALIHFHLINFPTDKRQALARMREIEQDCGVRINHTFEDSEFMSNRPQLKGGVCVNTRYIYLPEYLAAYAGVTITDIDGWLLKSIKDLSDFGDHDSLVSSWIWRKNTGYWRLPWSNLSGGFCSIKSTDRSKQFAGLVAHYLARLFQRNAYHGKPLFYADQAAHFLCLQFAVKNWGMDVGFIMGGFAQSAELPFQGRNAGKRLAMQNILAELRTET